MCDDYTDPCKLPAPHRCYFKLAVNKFISRSEARRGDGTGRVCVRNMSKERVYTCKHINRYSEPPSLMRRVSLHVSSMNENDLTRVGERGGTCGSSGECGKKGGEKKFRRFR